MVFCATQHPSNVSLPANERGHDADAPCPLVGLYRRGLLLLLHFILLRDQIARRDVAADEVAVAVAVVDAGDIDPVLPVVEVGEVKGSLLPRVGVAPLVGGHLVEGMGGILEHIILLVSLTIHDLLDVGADALHHLDEAVELLEALTLGRLHHEGAVDGEGERRGVVVVVHESLGDVEVGDADSAKVAALDDALVSHEAGLTAVEDTVVLLQAGGEVVGIEDRSGGGSLESLSAHHADVGVGDTEDAGAAEGC